MNIIKAIQATAWIVNVEKGYYNHNILTIIRLFMNMLREGWY